MPCSSRWAEGLALASTAAARHRAVDDLGLAAVEWKLDGIRIQVHRLGDEVRTYTRNLNDITERLLQVAELARSFPSPSGSCSTARRWWSIRERAARGLPGLRQRDPGRGQGG
ncbi:MAG: hypothetical protein R2711_05655 [Acidimicrobiales bacterium]